MLQSISSIGHGM